MIKRKSGLYLSSLALTVFLLSSCASINRGIDSILGNEAINNFQRKIENSLTRSGSTSAKNTAETPTGRQSDKPAAKQQEGAGKNQNNLISFPVIARPAEIFRHDPASASDVSVYRAQGVHPRVKNLSPAYNRAVFADPEKKLPYLVDDLLKDIDDPFDQAKILHDWVAVNIRYNAAAYFAKNIPSQDAYSVVRTQLAVCEGYANLFSRLADLAGIRNIKIHGYARGAGYSIFSDEDVSNSNHAWNAVKIRENWYLLDVTWDSGHLSGRTAVQQYETSYLFIKPEHMIYTHLPTNPAFQFLEPPWSREKFKTSPYLRGELFLVLPDFSAPLGLITETEGIYYFSLSTPEEISLSGRLLDQREKEIPDRVFIQKNEEGISDIRVSFPAPGNYILSLFAQTGGSGKYDYICEFGFRNSGRSDILYPLLYAEFGNAPYRLISPLDTPAAGETTEFILYLPGVSEAYLSDGKSKFPLEPGEDSIFSAEVAVPRGSSSLSVYIRKADQRGSSYTGLLKFPVMK